MSTQLKLTLQRNKKVEGDQSPRENGWNRSGDWSWRGCRYRRCIMERRMEKNTRKRIWKRVEKTRRPRSIYRKSNITSEYIPVWVYIWHLFHAIYVKRNPISEIPARRVRKFSQHQLSDISADIFVSVIRIIVALWNMCKHALTESDTDAKNWAVNLNHSRQSNFSSTERGAIIAALKQCRIFLYSPYF